MDRNFAAEPECNGVDDGTRRAFLRLAAGAASVAGAVLTPNAVQATEANPLLTIQAFRDIRRHENAHVDALLKLLGSNARPKPIFRGLRQPNIRKFIQVSRALENTGAGTYLGAVPAISSSTVLVAADSIAFIEARHASFLNALVDQHITTNVLGKEQSFETPLTQAQVLQQAGGFIAGLNGGPPVSFNPSTPSAANDIAILNFALALEFLEAEYYNLNARFFGF